MTTRGTATTLFANGRGAATTLFAACIGLLAISPGAAQEDDTGQEPGAASELVRALEAHRHPLALENGRLTDSGADLLLSAARAARYTLVGETHGVAEVPRLVGALFRALRSDGYRHLALEIGPVQAERAAELLSGPRPMETYRAYLREHWPAVPFYSWKTEVELLVDAVEVAGPSALWGLDYDIMGDRYPLRRLRELAPDTGARAAAERLVRRAEAMLRRATRTGDLSAAMMFSEPPSTWRELRKSYDPAPGSEADRILTQLEATAHVNEAWIAGRRWTSNRRRVRLLKDNFLRLRAEADPEARVMVKMGGFHLNRGRTRNNTYDVGNFLGELARAEAGPVDADPARADGGRSFHVLVLGGPGRRRGAIDPRTLGLRPVPTVLSDETHWSHPLARAAYHDRWTVYDLRPLRPLADAGQLGDPPAAVVDVIFGYDAVVVLVGSTAAELLFEEAPSLP